MDTRPGICVYGSFDVLISFNLVCVPISFYSNFFLSIGCSINDSNVHLTLLRSTLFRPIKDMVVSTLSVIEQVIVHIFNQVVFLIGFEVYWVFVDCGVIRKKRNFSVCDRVIVVFYLFLDYFYRMNQHHLDLKHF